MHHNPDLTTTCSTKPTSRFHSFAWSSDRPRRRASGFDCIVKPVPIVFVTTVFSAALNPAAHYAPDRDRARMVSKFINASSFASPASGFQLRNAGRVFDPELYAPDSAMTPRLHPIDRSSRGKIPDQPVYNIQFNCFFIAYHPGDAVTTVRVRTLLRTIP